MYTIDGTEVSVVKKIEEGYLAKLIYSYNDYHEGDGENESELEEVCEQVAFYEKLYENPPTEKYAKEVSVLLSERDKLETELSNLKKLKSEEEYLLNKINRFPILKKLADYLTGDFKFHMKFDSYEILPKEKAYLSTNVKVVNFRSDGWCLYKLRNENSESYDDTPFMIFNTIEEAVEYSRDILIARMQQYKKNEYWGSSSLKEAHDKISYTNPVKNDTKYLDVYNEVMSFLTNREKKRALEKLQKEIEEFEAKKKRLEGLEQAV